MPTFTPLSLRSGVLEGGMGVRFPAGLKTLGVVGLLKGACFGMPLSGAAERAMPVRGPVAVAGRDGLCPATSTISTVSPKGRLLHSMLCRKGPQDPHPAHGPLPRPFPSPQGIGASAVSTWQVEVTPQEAGDPVLQEQEPALSCSQALGH